jgi:hypothetical protein
MLPSLSGNHIVNDVDGDIKDFCEFSGGKPELSRWGVCSPYYAYLKFVELRPVVAFSAWYRAIASPIFSKIFKCCSPRKVDKRIIETTIRAVTDYHSLRPRTNPCRQNAPCYRFIVWATHIENDFVSHLCMVYGFKSFLKFVWCSCFSPTTTFALYAPDFAVRRGIVMWKSRNRSKFNAFMNHIYSTNKMAVSSLVRLFTRGENQRIHGLNLVFA